MNRTTSAYGRIFGDAARAGRLGVKSESPSFWPGGHCPAPNVPDAWIWFMLDTLKGPAVGQARPLRSGTVTTVARTHRAAPLQSASAASRRTPVDRLRTGTVGGRELVEVDDHGLLGRHRGPVQGDGHVEGVDDGMARAPAESPPGGCHWSGAGSEARALVGDRLGHSPRRHGVGGRRSPRPQPPSRRRTARA